MTKIPAVALTAEEVRDRILTRDREEVALLDLREIGKFGNGHLLWATSLPLGQLEIKTADLIPRKSVQIILCSEGENDEFLISYGSQKLFEFGYKNIFYLFGGVKAWEKSGFEVFSGINVPSKAFGEFIENTYNTPRIKPQKLQKMMEEKKKFLVLDSRPAEEYSKMNIPGGVNCPGAELVLRIYDLIPDKETPVIVNCAGRTRSIIGCQSLKNAKIPNPVFALENGTMGWQLAGYQLEYDGCKFFNNVSVAGRKKAREAINHVAKKYRVISVDWNTVQKWKSEDDRSTFLFDVRQLSEFEAGHLPTAISAPGGQLIQTTDEYIGVLGARVVLIDNDGIRATMTASWLQQIGWKDIFVLDRTTYKEAEVRGQHLSTIYGISEASCEFLTPVELKNLLQNKSINLIDLANSTEYQLGHIAGAQNVTREKLYTDMRNIAKKGELVLTSPKGQQAVFASCDLQKFEIKSKVLMGGTASWVSLGFDVQAGSANMDLKPADVWSAPYDLGDDRESVMKKYLSWEIDLVQQIKRDGTTVFKKFPN